VVQAGLAEQGQAEAARVVPQERLGVVVEVDEQGVAGASIDSCDGRQNLVRAVGPAAG
jgi:hypothetical protein